MPRYAEHTSVSTDRSQQEIDRILRRYGADSFAYGWRGNVAHVGFTMNGRQMQFRVEMPNPHDRQFTHTPGRGQKRTAAAAEKEYEQATRQRWRALVLLIKAKLEAVEAGIITMEDAFLAHTMLPSGQTVGEWAQPRLEAAYDHGEMPALLPGEDA